MTNFKIDVEKEIMVGSRNASHTAFRRIQESVKSTCKDTSGPHNFITKMLDHVKWSKQDLMDMIGRNQLSFERSILESMHNSRTLSSIPHYTHKVWMTSPDSPAMPALDDIERYLAMASRQPSDLTHFFWVNSVIVGQYITELSKTTKCHVVIMDVRILSGETLSNTVETLVAERKYVLAADAIKFLILNRFGGFYSDLGVTYHNDICALTELSDYVVLLGNNLFFQTCCVACPPKSNLSSLMLAIMNTPEILDRRFAIAGTTITAIDEVQIYSGLGFTACSVIFNSPRSRLLVLPPRNELISWRSHKSWYPGFEKFGNIAISQSKQSIIEEQIYAEFDAMLERNLYIFGNIGIVEEQIKMLLKARKYFESNPTQLCNIMCYNGSDKAQGWHNYGYIYNFVLERFVGISATMLEIGIGTNYLDTPSSMGTNGVPGASLRGWKEFFVNATVFGADVDKRVLFQEDGIRTYFVDQTQEDTIDELFASIGHDAFDLIIDDGLHTYDANVVTLRKSFEHLRDGGIYIIEDVEKGLIPIWKSFLEGQSHRGVLISIPNELNNKDNTVIMIFK